MSERRVVCPDWPFGRPNPQTFPVLAKAWDSRSKCWSTEVKWSWAGSELSNNVQMFRRSYEGSGGAAFVEWLDLNWNSLCADVELALEYGEGAVTGTVRTMCGVKKLLGRGVLPSDRLVLRELQPLQLRLERSGQDLKALLLWEGSLQVEPGA